MKKFKGVVSAASPEAARAGAEVLSGGGNAIDAAVAVSFALGVTEPAGSGIGGQGTFIIHKPYHVPFVINGTSFSPAKLPDDVVVAHKTGLENGVCHDVGIVFTEKGNFLISALVKHNNKTSYKAKKFISKIASLAYNYYNTR